MDRPGAGEGRPDPTPVPRTRGYVRRQNYRADAGVMVLGGLVFAGTGVTFAVFSGVDAVWAVAAIVAGILIGAPLGRWQARGTVSRLLSGDVVLRVSGWRRQLRIAILALAVLLSIGFIASLVVSAPAGVPLAILAFEFVALAFAGGFVAATGATRLAVVHRFEQDRGGEVTVTMTGKNSLDIEEVRVSVEPGALRP